MFFSLKLSEHGKCAFTQRIETNTGNGNSAFLETSNLSFIRSCNDQKKGLKRTPNLQIITSVTERVL